MKISISYPPLQSKKGTPTIGQNRQFQWFSSPTFIYPVIPAYAATILKNKGYQVFWDDAIAQRLTIKQWKERILRERPDVIAIETKTPVIKQHWGVINNLKLESLRIKNLPAGRQGWKLKIILMGDHVCARPEESLRKSKVDYAIAHGDYDFALLNLADHLSKGNPLLGGVWFRDENGKIKNTGPADISKNNLNDLPLIDRELTRWKDYARKNGNFKHRPGAYMMSGRDCWWGRCSFCSWTIMFPGNKFRTMSAKKALDEVGSLVKLGVREIMEDSGSLPVGDWLEEFCQGMIERGYNKKVSIGCNMRISGIKNIGTWRLMKKAGFRFVLFGVESANQKTLDRINKNLKVKEIEPNLKICKQAGLEPHATFMVGYPWETKAEVEKTVALAKDLFKRGIIDTLQATIAVPYPGTKLHDYCQKNDLLITADYEKFDQSRAVMKSPLKDWEIKQKIRSLYVSFFSPKYILNKILSIRSWSDVRFIFIAFWKWLGKLADFH